MAKNTPPLIFISYRRQDSSAASRWLGETLQAAFGAAKVFIDSDAIRVGDDWPRQISNALRGASVLIAVIGPNWLRLADQYGRRRLDKADDWVRKEIAHALRQKLLLLPLLVGGADLPVRESLPRCLMPMLKHQALTLRDDRWEDDRNSLLSKLEEVGFCRAALDRLPAALPNRDPQVFAQQLASLKTAVALTYRARNAARRLKEHPGEDDTRANGRGLLAALHSYHQAVESLLFEDRAILTDRIFGILHRLKHDLHLFLSLIEECREGSKRRLASKRPELSSDVISAYQSLDHGYERLVVAVQSHIGVGGDQGVGLEHCDIDSHAAQPAVAADGAPRHR